VIMSHKNKSAICGYLHIEGVMVGVVDPAESDSASRRNDRWWANRRLDGFNMRGGIFGASAAFKTPQDIIVVV
jgi:hypothetical protein